jgi:hypothetical protein
MFILPHEVARISEFLLAKHPRPSPTKPVRILPKKPKERSAESRVVS